MLRTHQRRAQVAWGFVLAALTAFAVFVLPFFFPPTVPSRSEAYAAGASNRVAEIAVGLLSLAVAFTALRFSRTQAPGEPAQPLTRRWLWAVLAGMSALLLLLGAAMVRANIFYGEAEYFLTQLDKGLKLHAILYRTVQFAYGPILYWWPILWIKTFQLRALHVFGISTMPAYVGALLSTQAAGVVLLFYTVRALPMRRGLQAFAFLVLAVGSLPPTMGPNYSVFRFVVPMAFAVWLSRRGTLVPATAAAAVGTFTGFAVSSEAGIACLGAVVACATARILLASERRLRWLALIPAAIAGAALLIAFTGPEYFRMISEAGSGGYDLLLTPEPRTLLVLVSVVALAPLAVARALRSRSPAAALLAGIYGTALGQMPVALGRCDSVHEFFFSLGAILLSLVAIDRALSARALHARTWVAAILLWVLMAQHANYNLYKPEFTNLAHAALHPNPDTFDVQALERQLNGQPVFLIDDVSWTANEELLDRHLLMPNFFCEQSSVWRRPAEERKIAEMRAGNFALDPDGGTVESTPFDVGPIARWKRFGLVYRRKQAPFEPGILTEQELARNWTPVARISDQTLYRKLR